MVRVEGLVAVRIGTHEGPSAAASVDSEAHLRRDKVVIDSSKDPEQDLELLGSTYDLDRCI